MTPRCESLLVVGCWSLVASRWGVSRRRLPEKSRYRPRFRRLPRRPYGQWPRRGPRPWRLRGRRTGRVIWRDELPVARNTSLGRLLVDGRWSLVVRDSLSAGRVPAEPLHMTCLSTFPPASVPCHRWGALCPIVLRGACRREFRTGPALVPPFLLCRR